MEPAMNCKHGLTTETCAYCSGLITKPSEVGTGHGLSLFRDDDRRKREDDKPKKKRKDMEV